MAGSGDGRDRLRAAYLDQKDRSSRCSQPPTGPREGRCQPVSGSCPAARDDSVLATARQRCPPKSGTSSARRPARRRPRAAAAATAAFKLAAAMPRCKVPPTTLTLVGAYHVGHGLSQALHLRPRPSAPRWPPSAAKASPESSRRARQVCSRKYIATRSRSPVAGLGRSAVPLAPSQASPGVMSLP